MSITGSASGGSGTPGSHIYIGHRELESTASTAAAMASLHIAKDTLTLPLIQVDQDTRKYQSSANRPVLAPLSATRGSAPTLTGPADESWKSIYKEMTEKMPKDFRPLFESAMLLPADKRNPNITTLDETMQTAAKLINTLRKAAIPLDPESLAAERAADNIAKPYTALHEMAYTHGELLAGAQAYLGMVGANNPNFDAIANKMGSLALISEDLKTAMQLLTESATEKEGKELLASVNTQIAALSGEFDRSGAGGEFLLLGNTLHATQLATAALLLDNLGASALLIGLSNATYGLDSGTSALGVTGSGFSAVSKSMADGIKSTFLDHANAGQQSLFLSLYNSSLITTLLFGTLMYDANIQNQGQKEITPKEVAEQNFSQELKIDFLTHSGMLSGIGNLIAKESGASESQQTPMAALLETSLMLMLVAPSIKGGDLTSTGPLLNGINDQLESSLAAGIRGKGGHGGHGGGGETEEEIILAQELKVAIQQAEIALKNKNSDGLLYSLEKSLEFTGATKDSFIGDVSELKKTAHTTSENLDVSANSAATTNITQAA